MNNKRKLALLVLTCMSLGTLLLSSCLRDEDKDLFNHPIVISGEMDPNIGLPIADAELTVGGLLDMVQQFSGLVTPDENNFVVIHYDTSALFSMRFDGNKARRHRSPRHEGGERLSFSTSFSGDRYIDLFSNIDMLQQVSVHGVIVNLLAQIDMEATDQLADLVDNYGAEAWIDSLMLVAYDGTGDSVAIRLGQNRFEIQPNLTQTIQLFNDYDASELLNLVPKRVKYQANVNISVPSEVLTSIDISTFILDSLTVRKMDINSQIDVRFPLNMCITGLSYGFSSPLNVGNMFEDATAGLAGDNLDLQLKNSTLILNFDNGLPYNIKLNATVLDSNNAPLFRLFETPAEIAGAPISVSPNDAQLWISNGSTKSQAKANLTDEQLLKFKKAMTIRFDAALTTTDYTQNKCVAIRTTDKIGIGLFMIVNPHASFNIPIN